MFLPNNRNFELIFLKESLLTGMIFTCAHKTADILKQSSGKDTVSNSKVILSF